jgi:hypothetical protein
VYWNAYELCKELSGYICPYCNSNFTNTIIINKNGVARTQLDHFLPRSFYPIFAVSLYNLIPACYNCNHSKRDWDTFDKVQGCFNVLHPYILIDDTTNTKLFDLKEPYDLISNILSPNGQEVELEYELRNDIDSRIKESMDLYNLVVDNNPNKQQGHYSLYNRELKNDINFALSYSNQAIKNIANLLEGDGTDRAKDLKNILSYDLLLSLIPVKPSLRVLGKLKKDLYEEILKEWGKVI